MNTPLPLRQKFSVVVACALAWASLCAHSADLRIGLSADVTTMDPHFLASQPNYGALPEGLNSMMKYTTLAFIACDQMGS